ncbi:MAG: hypothetical protein ACOYEB_12095, partial [Enterococcus lemanii]
MENLDLLTALGFERIAGSKEEVKARHIIQAEVEKLGLSATVEPFEIAFPADVQATLTVGETN